MMMIREPSETMQVGKLTDSGPFDEEPSFWPQKPRFVDVYLGMIFFSITYPPENVARMHVLGLIPLQYLKYDRGICLGFGWDGTIYLR
jgi:hypothetical protein